MHYLRKLCFTKTFSVTWWIHLLLQIDAFGVKFVYSQFARVRFLKFSESANVK